MVRTPYSTSSVPLRNLVRVAAGKYGLSRMCYVAGRVSYPPIRRCEPVTRLRYFICRLLDRMGRAPSQGSGSVKMHQNFSLSTLFSR